MHELTAAWKREANVASSIGVSGTCEDGGLGKGDISGTKLPLVKASHNSFAYFVSAVIGPLI